MSGIFKRIGGWFTAVLTTVALGAGFQTQNILARLEGVGADVAMSDRIAMTFYDLYHFGSVYIIFVAIALTLAFLAAGLVFRLAKFGRPLIYIAAGAIALMVMLFAMKNVFFGIPFVGGARDELGVSFQILAGAIGGFVFTKINRPEVQSGP